MVLAGLVWLSGLFAGCRENPPLPPVVTQPPALVRWQTGDAFYFDTWQLSLGGNRIDTSRCVSLRRVLRTGASVQGYDGVVVMLDSIAFRGRVPRLDTLYLYQGHGGDLWQYGLLASIASRYNAAAVPPRWDRIAALSLGSGASWTVGQVDTLSNVVGNLFDEVGYYTATLNSAPVLFKPLRAELYSPTFSYRIWVSLSPPLVARIVEPSSQTVRGLVRELTAARIGG